MKAPLSRNGRSAAHGVLDCGGKRSATPLSSPAKRQATHDRNRSAGNQSGVAAALCHRSPRRRWPALRVLGFLTCGLLAAHLSASAAEPPLREQAIAGMKRAAEFYRAKASAHGGYVYYTSLDFTQRWGEGFTPRFAVTGWCRL